MNRAQIKSAKSSVHSKPKGSAASPSSLPRKKPNRTTSVRRFRTQPTPKRSQHLPSAPLNTKSFSAMSLSTSPTEPTETERPVILAPQQTNKLIEHVFLTVEVSSYLFYNQITISFPDHTPDMIINESTHALRQAFQDRPDGQDYQQRKLVSQNPFSFTQYGSHWNRYEWTIRQKEIDGSLDPLVIQTVLLDHYHNNLGARYVSSNSSQWFHRDAVTHVLQFPVDTLNYIGSYKETVYDQYGGSV